MKQSNITILLLILLIDFVICWNQPALSLTKIRFQNMKSKKLYMASSVSSTNDMQKMNIAPNKESIQTSSMIVASTNLVKNCVGAGVFSITSRLISIGFSKQITSYGIGIILLMSLWAAYNFWIIGETCSMTNSTTYAESWANTVSKNTEWIVQAVVTLSPIVSCLANTIVLTDVLKAIMVGCQAPLWLSGDRNIVILLLGALILFPICSLKDLSALRSVSVFGLFGQLLAMFILAYRLFDKSYFLGGQYYVTPIVPNIPDIALSNSPVSLLPWFTFASFLSYCFVTHYNAPRFYNELEKKTSDRFLQLSGTSFTVAGITYIITMLLGLLLFGKNTKSFLLNNLMSSDPLALIARSAFGASVLASFPLVFLSMRNWCVTAASKKFKIFSNFKIVTAFLLSIICGLAIKFDDIGVVGSFSGAIFGSSMMFIFPPIMYIRALQKKAKENKEKIPALIILANVLLLICGATLGVFGTTNSILSMFKS